MQTKSALLVIICCDLPEEILLISPPWYQRPPHGKKQCHFRVFYEDVSKDSPLWYLLSNCAQTDFLASSYYLNAYTSIASIQQTLSHLLQARFWPRNKTLQQKQKSGGQKILQIRNGFIKNYGPTVHCVETYPIRLKHGHPGLHLVKKVTIMWLSQRVSSKLLKTRLDRNVHYNKNLFWPMMSDRLNTISVHCWCGSWRSKQ